jgi:hypothetical protein
LDGELTALRTVFASGFEGIESGDDGDEESELTLFSRLMALGLGRGSKLAVRASSAAKRMLWLVMTVSAEMFWGLQWDSTMLPHTFVAAGVKVNRARRTRCAIGMDELLGRRMPVDRCRLTAVRVIRFVAVRDRQQRRWPPRAWPVWRACEKVQFPFRRSTAFAAIEA